MNDKQKRPLSKEKKAYPQCHPMNAQCDNIRVYNNIDFPSVDSVHNWRDCLLCLLTELVVIEHDREDKDVKVIP